MQDNAHVTAYFSQETAEDRFKLLAEAAFEGIIIHNGSIILDINEPACEMLKYTRKELAARPISVLFDQTSLNTVYTKMKEDSQEQYEIVCIKKSGVRFSASVRGKSLYTPNGKIRIVAIKDITRQKEYEQHLALQYKLSVLFSSDAPKNTVIKRFLKILCTLHNFDIGCFYFRETDSSKFICYSCWQDTEKAAAEQPVHKGHCINADMLLRQKYVWLTDKKSEQPEVLKGTPFHTLVGIAIPIRGKIQAACFLCMKESVPKQKSVLTVYSTVGTQAGNYLERIENRKQLILANKVAYAAPIGIFVVTAKGIILWQNYYNNRITCSEPASSQKKLPPQIYKILRKAIPHISAGNIRFSSELVCTKEEPNGAVYEVIITPLAEKSVSNRLQYIITVSDISAHKKLEQVLNQYSSELQEEIKKHKTELSAAYQKILSQQRLEQELTVAGAIQQGLLPQTIPGISGWDIAATAIPANLTGGDLYDFIQYDADTYYIIMADISGKGITAALFTSAAKAIIREKIQQGNDPGTIVALVNSSLYADLSQIEMFITVFILKMDIRSNMLTYANAGHTRTIIIRRYNEQAELLDATTVPVGILPEIDSVSRKCIYDAGSCIVLYSDGITEAVNPKEQLYGEKRLIKNIRHSKHLQAAQLIEEILENNIQFRETAAQTDDCTIIVLKSVYITKRLSLLPVMAQTDRLISEVKKHTHYLGADFASEMELLCTELFINILHHSMNIEQDTIPAPTDPPVIIDMQLYEDRMILDFYNTGNPFDENTYTQPVLDGTQIGGYGIYLIKHIADTVSYEYSGKENHWHIEKKCKNAESVQEGYHEKEK